jgi:murein DD-endopeptidase MepM/ murein hydrolase activator NlpD
VNYKNFTSLNSRSFTFYSFIAFLVLLLATLIQFDAHNNISISTSSVVNKYKEYYFYNFKKKTTDSLNVKVTNGDTLAGILDSAGINNADIQKIISKLNEVYDLKRLAIGQQILLNFENYTDFTGENDEQNFTSKLQSIRLQVEYGKEIIISRGKHDQFAATIINIPLKRYVVRAKGTINNSLIATASELNIPPSAILSLIKAYSYDVDFQRDIQPGNEIDVFFERYYRDNGEYSHDGEILFSSLSLDDRTINLYKYTDNNGNTDFYNEEGRSVRKELLRTPLNVTKISSGFGMRKHPVLGYSKMHKGVDFAAPIGTPIFAAGNGVIEEIGRKGAYGNYIRIRHNRSYSTAYAHASRFSKGLRRGVKVKQGEVIAYVGTTGRSTGPHLHYEVIVNNQQINPLSIKLTPGLKLAGSELKKFNQLKSKLHKLMHTTNNQTELAFNTLERFIK